MPPPIPTFSSLPLDKAGPHHNAWGLYGPADELGTLNRLSDPLIASAAASEIRTGTRVNLDLPLDVFADRPFFDRQPFRQHAYRKHPRVVNDDVWTLNSQSSSQWDGLRHFGYQEAGVFYNGVGMGDIHGEVAGETQGGEGERRFKSSILGVGAWAEKGGIVGRGILLDVRAWQEARGIGHDAFATVGIPVATLREVARGQGTEVRFGDILLVRTGYTEAARRLSAGELGALKRRETQAFAGVEAGEGMMEFLWENFSAAGGDQPAFEAWPAPGGGRGSLHEVMLAGWGMPIGEFLDLEELGRHCREVGRWSFFVVSQPVYVPGGVATPANMVAIF